MENVISVSSSASGRWRRSFIWCFIILSVVSAINTCFTHLCYKKSCSFWHWNFFTSTVCRPFGSFVGSVYVDAHDVGEHFRCSLTLHLKDDRLLCSVEDPELYRLKILIHPTPFCHLLFSPRLPPSFLSDVCFKVRHRSGCLFPAFLQAHPPLSITFICHGGSDGLSTQCLTSTVVAQQYACKDTLDGKGRAHYRIDSPFLCLLAMPTCAERARQGRREGERKTEHAINCVHICRGTHLSFKADAEMCLFWPAECPGHSWMH